MLVSCSVLLERTQSRLRTRGVLNLRLAHVYLSVLLDSCPGSGCPPTLCQGKGEGQTPEGANSKEPENYQQANGSI